jgi:hypothetical protein
MTGTTTIAGIGAVIGPPMFLAAVEAMPNVPSWLGNASPWAIFGFMVWYLTTNVGNGVKELTTAVSGLKEEQARSREEQSKTRVLLETQLANIHHFMEKHT